MLQPISLGLRCQRPMRTSRSKPDLALVPETQESTQPTRQALTSFAHPQSASSCWRLACALAASTQADRSLRSACTGAQRVCWSCVQQPASSCLWPPRQHLTCPAGSLVAWTPASPSFTGSCRSAPEAQNLTDLSCCHQLSARTCASSSTAPVTLSALPGMHLRIKYAHGQPATVMPTHTAPRGGLCRVMQQPHAYKPAVYVAAGPATMHQPACDAPAEQ